MKFYNLKGVVFMITFSVNSDLSKDKAKKVFKLIQDMNSFNRDYIGEAYIHLMTGDSKNINLDSYAKLKKIEEHRELTKYDTKEENIVDIDDLQNGDIGTISNELFDPKNYEEIREIIWGNRLGFRVCVWRRLWRWKQTR